MTGLQLALDLCSRDLEPTSDMRAITLGQPYASALAYGPKRVENRTWPIPRSVRLPAVIAIHAGLSDWPDDGVRDLWPDYPSRVDLPRRSVLGAMRIVRCVRLPSADRAALSPWASGPWVWVVDRVWPLPRPIRIARGGRGLWWLGAVSPGAVAALEEVIRGS